MLLKNNIFFFTFYLFFPTHLWGWGITLDPFIGGQGLGSSEFTYTYQNGTTQYHSKVWDYTYGTRLSYIIFEKWRFLIDGGAEYYQGKEVNTRYSLSDKWDKSNLGIFLSFGWRDLFLRGSYYLSSQKKLTEDNNVGIGDLNDKLKGKGIGVGLGYVFLDRYKINFDYRSLTYNSIGSSTLPSSINSEIKDKEFSFAISIPLTFRYRPVSLNLGFLKSKEKILTKQLGSVANDQAGGIALDDYNNIYITGYTEGNLNGVPNAGDADIFLVKYNKNGKKQWSHLIGKSSTDVGNGVAVDYNNNVYIAGSTDGGIDGGSRPGNTDIFLVKYNKNGLWQWSQQLWRPSTDYGYALDVDFRGDIYIAGATDRPFSKNSKRREKHILVAKYNRSGQKLWSKDIRSNAVGSGIKSDKRGNVFILGTASNRSGEDENIVLYKLNSYGKVQWARKIRTSSRDTGESITLDSNGNIYILGATTISSSRGSSSSLIPSFKSNILLVKFSPSGKEIWSRTIGTLEEDFGSDMALDSKGNIYITGHTRGSFPDSSNIGGPDILLLKLDPFGKQIWSKQFGTPYEDYGNALAIDSTDNISVTGFTFGDLDGNKNKGGSDIFLVKFNSSGEKL